MAEPSPEERRQGGAGAPPARGSVRDARAWLRRRAQSLGIKKGLALVTAAAAVLLKFVWVPGVVSRAAEFAAEGRGLELVVGGWRADLLDLAAVAKDVRVLSPGPYGRPELLRAEEVVLDLSVWRRLSAGSWVHEVRVRSPRLYLERQLAGHWNWQDVPDLRSWAGPPPPATLAGTTDGGDRRARFDVRRLVVEDLDVEWVDNLPGSSRDGILHSSRAIIHLDDLTLLAEGLRGPRDAPGEPVRLRIDGRAGGGRVSMRGEGDLFLWADVTGGGASPGMPRRGDGPGPALAAAGARRLWTPAFVAEIYLENVGAAAFSRLVPQAALRPVEGMMSGHLVLELAGRQVECRTDLLLADVTYAADPEAPALQGRPAQARAVQRGLEGFRSNERVLVPCGGRLDDPDYRFLPAVQTAVTYAGLEAAPSAVREVAAREHGRFADAVFAAGVDELRRELEARMGEELGSAAAGQVSAAMEGKQGGVVARGYRRVKRGVKRLFGRD